MLAVSIGHGVNSPTSLPDQTGNSGKFLTTNGAQPSWATVSGGGGGVTSVALDMPALFNVSGSPITSSGTFAVTFTTQVANTVLAGPASGADATPTFRALVTNDLPSTAVTPGSYTNTSLTVDAKGRITAASSGAAGVAGSDTQIQYNDGGALAGDADNVWDKTNNKQTISYSGVGTSQKTSILLRNSTAATSGNQQNSPGIQWQGQGWKTTSTAASQSVEWFADVLPLQGTTAPYSKWRLRSSINGGSLTDMFSIDSLASTSVSYPKVNLFGPLALDFSPSSTETTLLLKNNGSNNTKLDFGSSSTSRGYISVTSSGAVNIVGAASVTLGGNVTTPVTALTVNQNDIIASKPFYTLEGARISPRAVVGSNATGSGAAALRVNGAQAMKGVMVSGSATYQISEDDIQSSYFYCDTTGVASCAGTLGSCSSFSGASCPTVAGCTQTNCSAYSGTSSSACTEANAACTWDLGECSTFVNDQSGCLSAGFPSFGACSWSAPTCSDFYTALDADPCNTAGGCTPQYSGSCSDYNSNESGCTTSVIGCSWDSMTSECTGNYYNSCDGTYTGTNGTCSGGVYEVGTCSGGNYCEGTGSCGTVTTSSPCNAISGGVCSWTTGINIFLPAMSAVGIKVDNNLPLVNVKKWNSGGGDCRIKPKTGTTDTIQGATTETLSTQYDTLKLHGMYVESECSVFNDDYASCAAQATCAYASCSQFGDSSSCGDQSGYGCSWNGVSSICEGTYTGAGTCSGTYPSTNLWLKW